MNNVSEAFGVYIDYAQFVKLYEAAPEGERRYSPAECTGAKKVWVSGCPNLDHISTSYVERQNLTMRTSMRRFTHLTNRFSKKVENHMHATTLNFMYYNFAWVHTSLASYSANICPTSEMRLESQVPYPSRKLILKCKIAPLKADLSPCRCAGDLPDAAGRPLSGTRLGTCQDGP